ncbi:hypothetical protein [Rhizobium tubonense]|uniref:Uncharacterized protein n=1 Tax=Rhizobium tubonense TaxID=484088 RepID=A0A2W4EBQ6_9HYPH|nr:hypothetical protein [Rhizobium tubonense]PZM09583.1 hypothetical protein CPY51_25190 [Rhizobium tubonense]
MTRLLKSSSVFLAVALAASMALPALGGDFGVGGRGFPRPGIHGTHFGNGGFGFQRNFHARGRNQFASGDRFPFQGRDFRHHNGDRMFGGRNNFARNGNGGFGGGNYFRSNRPQRLYTLGGYGANGGSSVRVILRDQPDYGFISNYAGATDVYRADGGTYATGYSYSSGGQQQGSIARPRAKIIDVARMPDVCSNENGVCVIRP